MSNFRFVPTLRLMAILLGTCLILSVPMAVRAVEPTPPKRWLG